MLGKKLTKNLISYFESLSSINVPVVTFDNNTDQELPLVAVGYTTEQNSFAGSNGHYTIKGFATVKVQGYEDPDNDTADALGASVVEALQDRESLFSALNKPLSGADSRPLSGFCLNGLFIRGVGRETEGTSTTVEVEFDAFCAAKD